MWLVQVFTGATSNVFFWPRRPPAYSFGHNFASEHATWLVHIPKDAK